MNRLFGYVLIALMSVSLATALLIVDSQWWATFFGAYFGIVIGVVLEHKVRS